MGYQTVFGGTPIQTSQQTYLQVALTADLLMFWPKEDFPGQTYVSDVMDVTPSANGYAITLPDARYASTGTTSLISNLSGSYAFTVKDSTGSVLLTASAGTVWIVYLRTNSTQAGTWGTYQLGAQAASINLAAIAGSGVKAISTSLNQSMPVAAKSSNYTVVDGDRAKVLLWTGGAGTFTLPSAATVGTDWFIQVKNAGTGTLTVSPPSGTIDAAASLSLPSTTGSAIIFTDGTNYYSVGLGASAAAFAFDYITFSIAGTGDYTISGAQLNRISYKLTGVLTGNRNLIVPNSLQQYWIDNETSGAFTLTVKTAAGTGVTIAQGQQAIVYCDGTNVVPGMSGVTLPIAIASGGTGGTTAASARTNLGSSTVGDAVFIAASASAARTALGSGTIGDAVFLTTTAAGAISALTGGLLTINGSNAWTVAAAAAGTTWSISAVSGSPGLRVNSAAADNGRLAITATGVREWQLVAVNADGSFRVTDQTGGIDLLQINAGGPAFTYESAYTINALTRVATMNSPTGTGTLTGCTTSPTCTVQFSRVGSQVTATIPTLGAASNATTMSLTGSIPASLRPTRTQLQPALMTRSGVDLIGYVFVNAGSADIGFQVPNAVFVSDGLTKGWPSSITFTWSLD